MAQLSNKYLYNNTAIGMIAVLATMQNINRMDIANVLLINPFLLHSDTLMSFKPNSNLRSIEELLAKHPKTVVNFSDRYESLLTMTMNCLIVAVEAGFVTVDDGFVYATSKLETYEFTNNIGHRAKRIIKASPMLAKILQADSLSLYYNLQLPL
ncbi:three component ABC system middle component [Hymenobacter monticola]|uniref:three component ABC system middle component n=1 Tax=Hymenobacter monticola TaxID=1705399 RepID=UPI0036D35224